MRASSLTTFNAGIYDLKPPSVVISGSAASVLVSTDRVLLTYLDFRTAVARANDL